MRTRPRIVSRWTSIAEIVLLSGCERSAPLAVGPPGPLWAPDASLVEILDVAEYLTDEYLLRARRSTCASVATIPDPRPVMRVALAELPDGSIVRVWPSRDARDQIAGVEFDRVWPGRGGIRISDRRGGLGEVWALRYAGRPQEQRDQAIQTSHEPADLAALRSLGTRVFALACPRSLHRQVDLRDIVGTDDGYAWKMLWVEGARRP